MILKKRKTSKKDFNAYKKFLSAAENKKIQDFAKQLKGLKIVHINSTPCGGGVAEILKSLIPLEQSLGINSSWHYITASADFFNITKKFHNGLQGFDVFLSEEQKKYYLNYNKRFSEEIKNLKPDLVIIHDPQPMAVSNFFQSKPMILRMHLDSTNPDKEILKFLTPYINQYKAAIFTLPEYVPKNLKKSSSQKCKIYISQPAIDPLEDKNEIISYDKCKDTLAKIGINPNKPLIAQVSRFDTWKNPLGVIESFYLAKKKIPDLQLILSGIIEAKDDPTALEVLNEVKEYAKASKDIFVFSDISQLKKLKISHKTLIKTIQNAANPILQLSTREGFGLTVTEAMWRKKIVIGGNVGGIKFQIKNGESGYLVSTAQQTAAKIVRCLKNPDLRKKIGINAHKTVQKNFLITTLLADHLKIYIDIL